MPKNTITRTKAIEKETASNGRTVPAKPAAPAAPPAVAVKTAKTSTSVKLTPTRDEIAQRAYDLYVARGRASGHDQEDWVRAERELLGKEHRNN